MIHGHTDFTGVRDRDLCDGHTDLPPPSHRPSRKMARPMKSADGAKHAARTHYETLDVAPTASSEEIKAAYFKLARERHPDKGGSSAAFQRLKTAYDTLSILAKRKAADAPRLAAVWDNALAKVGWAGLGHMGGQRGRVGAGGRVGTQGRPPSSLRRSPSTLSPFLSSPGHPQRAWEHLSRFPRSEGEVYGRL